MGAACVSLLKVNIVDVTFERNAKKSRGSPASSVVDEMMTVLQLAQLRKPFTGMTS